MCWRLVLRNRRRYKAVMAGIAVGTAGFIVIQTMGDSVEKKMGEHLELLGEATVLKAYWENEDSYHPGQFTMRDVARLKRIPHLLAVAPVVSLPQVNAVFKTTEWSPGLFGVDNQYWMTQSPTVLRGRLIGPSDVVGRKTVCVLGQDVVKYLFENSDPLGTHLKAGNLTFEVVGILGGIQHSDIRRSIFIPISTAQNLFHGLYRIQEIFLRVDDWNYVESAKNDAMNVLASSHKGYENGIRIQFFPDRLQRVKSTVYLVKLFVYAALGVTIILGGLGITSVMLAAVQDRTREIGLRKALGARERIILLQFLIEAVFISFLSGAIGVAAGFSLVQLLKGPLGVDVSPAMITVSIIGGLMFTVFLGVISGIYPSIRASRMDSVTAMRFE
jgi:putative ABC transport system permease protein